MIYERLFKYQKKSYNEPTGGFNLQFAIINLMYPSFSGYLNFYEIVIVDFFTNE